MYRIFLDGELLFNSYVGQGIIYHVESANTHLIDAFAFDILSIIDKEPGIECGDLMSKLENRSVNEKDDSKDYLLSVLMALQKIDLLKLKE